MTNDLIVTLDSQEDSLEVDGDRGTVEILAEYKALNATERSRGSRKWMD
mgnify:CR=1 FL=1|tara:strand:+ start:185 stop:331 length:147 start_codon:yes stop_codon:yes gene_type:complete